MTEDNNTEVAIPESVNTSLVVPSTAVDFSIEDIPISKLNVVQKMSNIGGSPGDIVIDHTATWLKNGKVLPITVVTASKCWQEKVPFDAGIRPRIARTREEYEALKADAEKVVPRADFLLFIPWVESAGEIDEDTAREIFPYVIDGVPYQFVRLVCTSFAYDYTYKVVNAVHAGRPGSSLFDCVWDLGTKQIDYGKYSWPVPVLKRTDKQTPDAIKQFITNLANNQ